MSKLDTITAISGVLCIAGGCTFAVMFTDAITNRAADKSHRADIEAMEASADALRKRLTKTIADLHAIQHERTQCPPQPEQLPVKPQSCVVAEAKAAPATEPKTIFVYRTKAAPPRKQPSGFCEILGCAND